MNGILYSVFLDGNFCGLAEEEDECWDIADAYEDRALLDDDVDRVTYHKIDVNRYFCDHHHYTNDKLSDDTILCYSVRDCQNAVKQLNNLQLKLERSEAKIRAREL